MARQQTPGRGRIDPKAEKRKVTTAKAAEKAAFAAERKKLLLKKAKEMGALRSAATAHRKQQTALEKKRGQLEKALAEIARQQEEEWKTGRAILRKLEAAQKELTGTIEVDPVKPIPPRQPFVARADALLVMTALMIQLIAKAVKKL